MLNLVFGISGTGKTSYLLKLMQERAENKQTSIYLVPEQFSSSAEMLVYKTMGDAQSGYVEVVSFRTMAERILKMGGGLTIPVLTEAGRTIFVRRVLDSLGDETGTFAKHKRNHAFCNMCANTLEELKTAGATPTVLHTISIENKEPKFEELAVLFAAYEAAIAGVALDPTDRLRQAAKKADCGYLTQKVCFIDNFDGFTAPEYELLNEVVARCEDVHMALCCDTLAENQSGLGLFSPVRKTALKLQQKAQKNGQRIFKKEMVRQYRATKKSLAELNNFLAFEENSQELIERPFTDDVTVTAYDSDWDEVRSVAATMHKLAIQGVPYSKMAVVCRNLDGYQVMMERAFHLFEIPYFVDAPTTIEYTAPVVFLRSALRIIREGFTSEAILALLKTGLCGVLDTELAALENYVYAWRPKAAQWKQPFENNPDGMLIQFNKEQVPKEFLAEQVRARIVPVLQKFVSKCRNKTVNEVCKQLYMLLEEFGAPAHALALENVIAQWQTMEEAEERKRAWDVAMDLLDQMNILVGNEVLEAMEFDDLFLLLVRSTDFGTLPQSLECAIFTSADRMRLAQPEVCFILGVAEGEFPMQVGYSGLLTHTDRDLLVKANVEMPGSFENRTLLEEMFFYRALTAASNQLYISWPRTLKGAPQSISAPLQNICDGLNPPRLKLEEDVRVGTPFAAFDRLSELYRENTEEAATLQQALEEYGDVDTQKWLSLLKKVQNTGVFQLQKPQMIEKIVGAPLTLTATKAEQYYRCQFAFYMEQILKARPLRRAELSASESGTFVHYILECVMQEAGANFGKLTNSELLELARKYGLQFIIEKLPELKIRDRTVLDNVMESVANLLMILRDSTMNSEFVPDAVELPIKDIPGGVPPLELETAQGNRFRITGEVDRVDVLRKNGKTYLSIIDYKTGKKEFDLTEVYCGLNMQMMVYMDALCKNATNRYPNAIPAGVLYIGADPAPMTGERGEERQTYKVDGLLLNDEEILRAMDTTCSGIFLPIPYDKDRKPKVNKVGDKRPNKHLAELAMIGNIAQHVEMMFSQMADGVYKGEFSAIPLVQKANSPCNYCAYRVACRHEDGVSERMVSAPKNIFREVEETPNGDNG